MAFIGLKIPHEAARLLEGVEVPGDRFSASDMHVTVIYLGKGLSILDVAKAMCAASGVTSKTTPFLCAVKDISSFPANPNDGVPVICPIHSPGIMALNDGLKAEFSRLGIKFPDKYPEYKPHVTMSYLTDGQESYSASLPGPLTWTASELVIWGGDDGDGVLSVIMPFVLSPIEKIARRMVR